VIKGWQSQRIDSRISVATGTASQS
jgi:hypothetical protein